MYTIVEREQERELEALKRAFTAPQVLVFPKFNKNFVVEMDASAKPIETVMAQNKEYGQSYPVIVTRMNMNKA